MRRLAAFLFVLAAALVVRGGPALAQFNVPGNAVTNPWTLTTEYSADVVVVSNGQTFNSRVNRTSSALRSETPQGGQTVTAIIRLDRNLGWLLIPGTRNAAEVDLTGFPLVLALLRNPTATATAEGTETIDGMAVTRWRVVGGDPGARFDGRVWATAEGVVVKVEGVADIPQGRQPFSLVAHNIRIARQAPNLFEIPNGYQRIQVPPQLLQAMMSGQLPGLPMR
jgi:hypothetical protein